MFLVYKCCEYFFFNVENVFLDFRNSWKCKNNYFIMRFWGRWIDLCRNV